MGKRGFQRSSCDSCHHRKVRCDIRQRREQGEEVCSFCKRRGEECKSHTGVRPQKARGIGCDDADTNTRTAEQGPSSEQILAAFPSAEPASLPSTEATSLGEHDEYINDLNPVSTDFQWPPQPPSLDEIYSLFYQDNQHSPFAPNEFLMDVEAFLSSNVLDDHSLNRDMLSVPFANCLDGYHQLDEGFIDLATNSFFASASLVTIIMSSMEAYIRQQIQMRSQSLLCNAVVCYGAFQLNREQVVTKLALHIQARLYSNMQPQMDLAEEVFTLVIMFELWPLVEQQKDRSSLSSLQIDVTSIQAMVQMLDRTHSGDTAKFKAAGEEAKDRSLILCHWFVYLLDSFEALDHAQAPIMSNRSAERLPLPQQDRCLNLYWINAAHKLASIARKIAVDAFRASIQRQQYLPPRLSSYYCRVLQAWKYDLEASSTREPSLAFTSSSSSTARPLDGFLSILYTHCCLRLESITSPLTAGVDALAMVAAKEVISLGSSCWLLVLETIEQTKESSSVLTLTRSAIDISFGCLYWGISRAVQAKKEGQETEAVIFLEGSRRFIKVLEKEKMSTRLEQMICEAEKQSAKA